MKKTFLLSMAFILSLTLSAQVQNINNLSTGIYTSRSLLTDSDRQVIGYAYLFNKGLANNDESILFEYVLLDKNLNKITNGDFEIPNRKRYSFRFTGIDFHDQKLYINSLLLRDKNMNRHGQLLTIIDLNTSEVVDTKFLNNNDFYEISALEDKKNSKVQSSPYAINFLTLLPYQGNIFYLDSQIYFNYFTDIHLYDQNYNLLLNYKANFPKEKFNFKVSAFKENRLTIFHSKIQRKFFKSEDHLITYDIETGKKIIDVTYNPTTQSDGIFSIPYAEYVNHKLMVVGEVKNKSTSLESPADVYPTHGIRRTIYDLEGNSLLDKTVRFDDIFTDYKFKNGRDKNGYKFIVQEYFNFNDGSFAVVLVKQKGDNNVTVVRTSDYILVNFDTDGNYKSHQLIEKEKQKIVDSYLFSQENKDENEVLFFYADIKKENRKKKEYLTINKLKDGVFTQEILPYETESSYLRFSKAKYGYILISEYDKEERESSVRLEKLNL